MIPAYKIPFYGKIAITILFMGCFFMAYFKNMLCVPLGVLSLFHLIIEISKTKTESEK